MSGHRGRQRERIPAVRGTNFRDFFATRARKTRGIGVDFVRPIRLHRFSCGNSSAAQFQRCQELRGYPGLSYFRIRTDYTDQ
jgi:hypothetical protein